MSTILIWNSKSKTRPHFIERGERLEVTLERKEGRRHRKMVIVRQFYNYPAWEDVERVSFSINRGVVKRLRKELSDIEESL